MHIVTRETIEEALSNFRLPRGLEPVTEATVMIAAGARKATKRKHKIPDMMISNEDIVEERDFLLRALKTVPDMVAQIVEGEILDAAKL